MNTLRAVLFAPWLWCASANAMELPRQDPVPGGIALVPISSDLSAAPSATFEGHRVIVRKENAQWLAVVGIPLDATPGTHKLTVAANGQSPAEISFSVQPKEYETQHLTIKNKRMVEPTAEDLIRIEKETVIMEAAFKRWSDLATDFNFIIPANGPLSSPFGLRRFFNGQPRKPHAGMDIAAQKGSLIHAPASAEVAATGNFFFNGNTVLLDHGQGLISMFNHLDRIDVKAGQHVDKDTILGTVGNTGRATGPHLHWTIVMNEARIDPALFFSKETLAALSKPGVTESTPPPSK